MRLIEIRDLDGPNIFLLNRRSSSSWRSTRLTLSPDAIAALAASMEPLAPSDDERAAGAAGLGDLLRPPAPSSTSVPGSSSRRCAGWRWRRRVIGPSPSVGNDAASPSHWRGSSRPRRPAKTSICDAAAQLRDLLSAGCDDDRTTGPA